MVPAFFEDITKYNSVSVVGMAKNAGKTVCLRALLDYYAAPERACKLAVTSIGTDGEQEDAVTHTSKPELTFYPGMLVQTASQYYNQRHLTAEILDVSRENTACGRLITARVLNAGKMIISGPSHTSGLRKFIEQVALLGEKEGGARTAVIDGALNRMSLASPFVSQAMVLCTGAALSKNITTLVNKTLWQYRLMNLPIYRGTGLPIRSTDVLIRVEMNGPGGPFSNINGPGGPFSNINGPGGPFSEKNGPGGPFSNINGPGGPFPKGDPFSVFGIDKEGEVRPLEIPSLLQINRHMEKIEPYCQEGCYIYVSGMLNDAFLKALAARNQRPDVVVTDFSKLFVSRDAYNTFTRTGSKVWVLQQPEILGVCCNPYSPEGYMLNARELREKLSEALNREVYDILA